MHGAIARLVKVQRTTTGLLIIVEIGEQIDGEIKKQFSRMTKDGRKDFALVEVKGWKRPALCLLLPC